MAPYDDDDIEARFSLPGSFPSDLKGRQSVRATFKLTARAIDALSIVAVHLGIKQKSLFDHLIDDTQSLKAIARQVKSSEFRGLARVQKTYVLSRKTLSCLEQTSKRFDTPRDALVEYSIQRLLPLIAAERQKHHLRKQLLAEATEHFHHGERLLRQAETSLGADDPLVDHLAAAMKICRQMQRQMHQYIERSEAIENF